MVPTPSRGASRARTARRPFACLSAIPLVLLPALAAAAGHTHTEACRSSGVGEYHASGEVGEYVTREIPEYVTGEIPEYVTGEIPEYQPHAGGEYIGDGYPPAVLGSAYVEVKPGVFILVHGAGGRAYARYARLISRLEGDRLITYQMLGFPPYRHRENQQDIVTEHWTYPERGITYIFCGDQLVGTRGY